MLKIDEGFRSISLQQKIMKRVGYLWKDVCSMDNIQKAITMSSKHKTKRREVKRVLNNRDFYAEEIHKMLLTTDIKWGEDRYESRVEPSSKKERELSIPNYYPDLIIQWAIVLVIEKTIRKGMCDCCVGSVPKRGPLVGKKRVEKWLKRDKKIKYIEKLDIRHFFQNVDVEVMKKQFRRKIKDPVLLSVLDEILDRGSRNTGKGLPIGYYTSQWFSNFCLERLDHVILEECTPRHYIRYVDDIVIMDSNKRKLREIKNRIDKELETIGLSLKDNWQIFKKHSRPLDFLGYRFYDGYVLLRKRILIHMFRLARRFHKQHKKAVQTARALMSLLGWLKHVDNGPALYEKSIKELAPTGLLKAVISNYDKAHRITPVIA